MRNKNCNWAGAGAVAAFLRVAHGGNGSQVPAAVWLLLPMNECTCCLCLLGLSALPWASIVASSAALDRMMSRASNFGSSARGHATHFAVCCCSFCCHCFHCRCCCCPLLLRKPRGCWCYCCRFWGCCCCCWLWGISVFTNVLAMNLPPCHKQHFLFAINIMIPLQSVGSVALQLQLVVNSIFTLFLVWEKNSLTCQQMLRAKGMLFLMIYWCRPVQWVDSISSGAFNLSFKLSI